MNWDTPKFDKWAYGFIALFALYLLGHVVAAIIRLS